METSGSHMVITADYGFLMANFIGFYWQIL